jgi:hypothetical protein
MPPPAGIGLIVNAQIVRSAPRRRLIAKGARPCKTCLEASIITIVIKREANNTEKDKVHIDRHY